MAEPEAEGRPGGDETESEYECELMIEALRRELDIVREQLAVLTNRLDISVLQGGETEEEEEGEGLCTYSRSPSGQRRGSGGGITRKLSSKVIHRTTLTEEHPQRGRSKEDTERRAAEIERQKHYLGVVDNVEHEKWDLRRRCLSLMETHIEQQLHQLQKTSLRLAAGMKRRTRREKAAKLQLKPVRYRSSGTDDRAFLTNLHQSAFYQIIELEHKLRTTGQLRSLPELKDFWDFMLSPSVPTSPSPSPHPRPTSQHTHTIKEEEEEEEEGGGHSWAITALSSEHYREKSPVTRSTTAASKSTDSTSLKFVPMKLPQLKSIRDILNEGKPLPDEMRGASAGHMTRMRRLSGERRRVQTMYQQARANEMAMRRLLPAIEAPNFDVSPLEPQPKPIREGAMAPRGDGVETDQTKHPPSSSVSQSAKGSAPTLHSKASPSSHPPPQPSSPPSSPHSSQPSSPHTPASQTVTFPQRAEKPVVRHDKPVVRHDKPVFVPLSMDSELQSGHIKEFKGKSSMWSNYVPPGR